MTYMIRPGVLTHEEIIANHFGVTVEEMKSRSRKREYVEARQVMMWYYMKYHKKTEREAGKMFGKDHSTAHYAGETVETLLKSDKLFRKKVQAAMLLLEKIPAPKKEE
jgi:chromosomal replication initiator protein